MIQRAISREGGGARPKIIHLITSLNVGGAQMMLLKLLEESGNSQLEHIVVPLIDGELAANVRDAGFPVIALARNKRSAAAGSIPRFLAVLRQERPTIILSWMYHANVLALLGHALHVPIVWNMRHSVTDLKAEKRSTASAIRVGRRLSSIPKHIIFNSEVSRQEHGALGYDLRRSCILPNGFDLNEFRPNQEIRARIRQELGIPQESLVVGMFARFHPMKNHLGFIDAAAMLAERYPDVHFVLAGNQVELNNEKLSKRIHTATNKERFHLLGIRTDMPDLNAALDIAVSASTHGEGFSNTIGEAMCCAVPCVSTDVGDAAALVGDTGLVVPPRDTRVLADALDQMLSMPAIERQEMGRWARERMRQKFSIEQIANQYEVLLMNVLRHDEKDAAL